MSNERPGHLLAAGPAVTGLGAGDGGACRGTRAVRCGRERWWGRPAGRLANGRGGKGRRRGGAPAALWPGSLGRGLRAQPGRRGPAPRALFGARTLLKGIPGHGAPPLGDAWRLDPPRRTDGPSGFPRSTRGNQAWRAGARAPGTAPAGGARADGAGAAGAGRWVRGRPGAGRQRLGADVRVQMFAGGGEPGKTQLALLPPSSCGGRGRAASKVRLRCPLPGATGKGGDGVRSEGFSGASSLLLAPPPAVPLSGCKGPERNPS